MRRAFFIGAGIGLLVFIQGALVLRSQSGPFTLLELWALAWAGVFGLTLRSTFAGASQAWVSLTFACVALVAFYALAGMVVRWTYLRRRAVGVIGALVVLITVHVGLYLWVVRSLVA